MATIKMRTKEERDAMQKRILALRAQGKSYGEIGHETGLTTGTISYYVTVRSKETKNGQTPSRKERSTGSTNGTDHNLERHISYAAGYCSAWLQVYAESLHVSRAVLADGLVRILRSQTRG